MSHVGATVTFTFLFSDAVAALRAPGQYRPQGWASARPPPGQRARCTSTPRRAGTGARWLPGQPGSRGRGPSAPSARVCLGLWTAGSWRRAASLSPAGRATAISEGAGLWLAPGPAVLLSKPSTLSLLSPGGGSGGRGEADPPGDWGLQSHGPRSVAWGKAFDSWPPLPPRPRWSLRVSALSLARGTHLSPLRDVKTKQKSKRPDAGPGPTPGSPPRQALF